MDNTQKRLNYLKYLFNFPKEFNINKDNINNLYFKIPEWCCTYQPEPLFKDIGPFEFNKVSTLLTEVYDSKKEKNSKFFSTIKKYKEEYFEVDNDDLQENELILNYIRCRPNIKILTQFSSNKIKIDKLYATKQIKLSEKAIICLLYQMFCLTDKFKSYEEIKKFVQLLGIKDKLKIIVYVYEGNAENLDKTCDFISNDFISAITQAEIYFNQNSITFLEDMLLERFLTKEFDRSRFLINTFKKMLLVKKLTLLEQSKFLLLAGTVLAAYGVRRGTDVDFFVSNLPEQVDTTTISKVSDIFLKENEKLFFFDGYHPKVRWPEFWKEWHKEWAKLFGANSMLECVHNPKYHFYFCGVKIIILQAEIERRNIRCRPASIADLIMIKRLLKRNFTFNPIKCEIIKFDKKTITDKPKFIKIVKHWLNKKYKTEMTKNEIDQITFE